LRLLLKEQDLSHRTIARIAETRAAISLAPHVTFRRAATNFRPSVSLGDLDVRGDAMNRQLSAGSALSAAIGLLLATAAVPTQAQMDMSKAPQAVKDNMARMEKNKLEKCYGINVVGKNDCAEGVHSCAGQATQARDPKSFVLLPAGDCSKIQGGNLKST
jgi:uncharacterized membrane protein